ncbi:MAG TPA: DUF1800 domain-containing protein [Rhizomicrobium sp.]|jgi:uncharacterized protein (DUF1800 family)
MSLEGAIAAHRFGLGARPGEIDAASGNPKGWLAGQLDGAVPQPTSTALQSGGALAAQASATLKSVRAAPDPAKQVAIAKGYHEIFMAEMEARFALGFTTARPFAERLVWFWSNHFTVSGVNGATLSFIGAYEREAIRPHVLGRFEDLVLATARHPAMLIYLNNAKSIGPDSAAGLRTQRGLNENYGRELMELHTLGVDGGYTQADVIALAKLLTGWAIDPQGQNGGFRFYPYRHEPGDIVLLGKTYPPTEEGGIQAIRDLANHPKTATHIARKFAGHFISENPSAASVEKLAAVFRRTGGDLKALSLAAVADPAAWEPANTRIRQPVEYVTAMARALDWSPGTPQPGTPEAKPLRRIMQSCRVMGEFPFSAPSPKGFEDTSAAWSGPDAILTRIELAHAVAQNAPATADPVRLADSALGQLLRADTRLAIQRAASGKQGLALAFASPEFQRR